MIIFVLLCTVLTLYIFTHSTYRTVQKFDVSKYFFYKCCCFFIKGTSNLSESDSKDIYTVTRDLYFQKCF